MTTIDARALGASTGVTRPDAATVPVPVLVRRGLERCWAARPRYRQSFNAPEFARHTATVAASLRREARWWSVLESWCYSPAADDLDVVFGRAVMAARAEAEERARDYKRMTERTAARLAGDR